MRLGVLLSVFLLAGCKDYGVCLKSHQEKYQWTQNIQVGCALSSNGICLSPVNVPIIHDGVREVCDQWEFPEGR